MELFQELNMNQNLGMQLVLELIQLIQIIKDYVIKKYLIMEMVLGIVINVEMIGNLHPIVMF
jgi:hypothetical protein